MNINVEDNINKSLDKLQLKKLQNPRISIIHTFFSHLLPKIMLQMSNNNNKKLNK